MRTVLLIIVPMFFFIVVPYMFGLFCAFAEYDGDFTEEEEIDDTILWDI